MIPSMFLALYRLYNAIALLMPTFPWIILLLSSGVSMLTEIYFQYQYIRFILLNVIYHLQCTDIKCQSIKLDYFYLWSFSDINVVYDGYSLFPKTDTNVQLYKKLSNYFSRVAVQFYIPTSKVWVIQLLCILGSFWCRYYFLF